MKTYLGYYHAAVSSYWHHGGEGGGCVGTDLSNSSGLNGNVSNADAPGVNGTYTTQLFASEAVRLIHAHDVKRPFYMYLAFEAVHDTGGKSNTAGGVCGKQELQLQAPLSLVQQFAPKVTTDTYKIMTAMIASLDQGVANISAALQQKGMFDSTVFIVTGERIDDGFAEFGSEADRSIW